MQHYTTFSDLIKEYDDLPYGRIYYQGIEENFETSQFWILSSKEAKDQELIDTKYGSIPESLVAHDAKSLIDVATFQDIIENKIEKSSVELDNTQPFVKAVAYYLKNDDFED